MQTRSKLATLGGATLLVGASLTLGSQPVTAADHIDADAAAADAAADITDFYAWNTEGGNIVAVVAFSGLLMPGDAANYDGDVLYTVNFDTDGDYSTVEHQIHVRFGQNMLEEWGVQFENVPGADAAFNGAVETELTNGDVTAIAGVYDDAFFFDFDGYNNTLANTADDAAPEDIAFAGLTGDAVDFFAGLNTMAIVVEFPAAELLGKDTTAFTTWATTGRI